MKDYKFKDVAHYYLGCKLIHKWSNRQESEPIILDANRLKLGLNDWLPILRKLSDMTEAEKVLFHNENRLTSTDNILPEIKAGNLTNWLHTERGVLVTTWLLSRNFDLFNLINSREAVTE
jgi:hypothetical protein